MIERWELSRSPQDKDPNRHKVRVRGTEDSLQQLLARIPGQCGRPFVTLARDYNWAFYIQSLSAHYRSKTIEILRQASPSGQVLESSDSPAPAPAFSPRPESAFRLTEKDEGDVWPAFRLNAGFLFSQFIVGPNARFAHAAAKVVADRPGKIYNPFFVSGPPGSGKTHLVQAIAHQLLERDPSARVLYVKAAKLGALLAEAAGSPLSARLRRRLLDLDLLIVDDLHELSGSAAVQEELSAAWTELQENGRQVVLASERSIEELGTFSGAMKTFLEGSLPVSLKELGRGTTLAVLKKRSESMDLNLGDDEIAFLAESAGFNLRKVDGFLRKVHAQVHLARQKADLEFLKRIVNPGDASAPEIPEEDDEAAPPPAAAPTPVKSPEVLERLRKAAAALTESQPKPPAPPVPEKPAAKIEMPPKPLVEQAPKPAPAPAVTPPAPAQEKIEIPKPAAAEAAPVPPAGLSASKTPEPKIEMPLKPIVSETANPAPVAVPLPKETAAEPPAVSAASPSAAAPDKTVALVAFYPEGQEKALEMCLEKLGAAISKYRLKLGLDVRARQVYDSGGKIDDGIFARECAAKECKAALALGPVATAAVSSETFARRASAAAAKDKIALHVVSWSELSKDSAYLNYALELSLLAAPPKLPVTAFVKDPAAVR